MFASSTEPALFDPKSSCRDAEGAVPTPETEQLVNLNLTSTYAEHWGIWEGVRELVQNWHDACLCQIDASARLSVEGSLSTELVAGDVGRISWGEALQLVNEGASIDRTALVLGFSKKSMHRATIGAFGEGLKVGALALIRAGMEVTVTSDRESWKFALVPHGEVSILTVRATKRRGPRRVTVEVRGLERSTWLSFGTRFLFLCRADADSTFTTTAGSLLLEPSRAGQLFVRGVFIAKLENMVAGVDLADCALDRDRATSLRREDVEHLAASLWLRAIAECHDERRRSLVARYFELLSSHDADIAARHAAFYVDSDVARELADLWFETHGDAAVPVCASDARDVLDKLKAARTSYAIVDAPKALTDILRAVPGVVKKPSQVLKELDVPEVPVAYASLSPDERFVLDQAASLAHRAMNKEVLSSVDVVESTARLPARAQGSRLVIDRRTLTGNNALERLALDMCNILAEDAVAATVGLVVEAASTTHRAPRQACCDQFPNNICAERELRLRYALEDSRREAVKKRADSDAVIERLQSAVDRATEHAGRLEVERMNLRDRADKEVAAKYEACVADRDATIAELRSQLVDRERDAQAATAQARQAEARLRLDREAHQRRAASAIGRAAALQAEVLDATRRLADRDADDEILALLGQVRDFVFHGGQAPGDKDATTLCAICVTNPINLILLPCRHFALCADCGAAVDRCPFCRSHIDDRLAVWSAS